MSTIQLNATDRAARGRNGWFRPATIEVSTSDLAHGRGIIVAVNSRARAGFPPIFFELAPEHARQLAAAILQQTEGDLVAQVQAADTQITALLGGQEMISLTVRLVNSSFKAERTSCVRRSCAKRSSPLKLTKNLRGSTMRHLT